MNDTFPSGEHCDHEALVAFLYDEADRADREAIAAHLAVCAACAEELASLRATRTQLAAWAPPDAGLGFQITSADPEGAARAFNQTGAAPLAFHQTSLPTGGVSPDRGRWWREPLPAWAQAAAAALIFAAGLAAGSLRTAPAPDAIAAVPAATVPAAAPIVAPVPARSAQAAVAPSALDFARFEQRLRALESGAGRAASASLVNAGRSIDEQAMLARVQAIVDERLAVTESRLRGDIAVVADATSQFEAQYRQLQQRVNRTQGVTMEQLQQSRAALGTFISFQQPGR